MPQLHPRRYPTGAHPARPAGPLVIAHRGASAEVAEHTLSAYERALEIGVDGVECDIRLTSDAHLVCCHDRTVDRTSSGRGVLATKSLAQLEELDWGSWHGGDPAELLTLTTLLSRLVADPGEPLALIEAKHPTRYGGLVERRLVEQLRDFGLTTGDLPGLPKVRVMSFSVRALQRMRELAPHVPRVQLVGYAARATVRNGLARGVQIAGLDVDFVRKAPGVVQSLQAAGHLIYVWTVNDLRDLDRCLELGVDAVITDRPREVIDGIAAGHVQ